MSKEIERLTTQNYYHDAFEFQRGKHEIVPGVMVPLTQADYNERIWLKLFEMENLEAELDIDLVEKALKRNEPMKPALDEDSNYRCARCHHIVDNHYCSDCGQALDWSDEK